MRALAIVLTGVLLVGCASAGSPSPSVSLGSNTTPSPSDDTPGGTSWPAASQSQRPTPDASVTPNPSASATPPPATAAPTVEPSAAPTARPTPVATPVTGVPSTGYHRVVAGDTLYSIGRAAGVSAAELVNWNEQSYPSLRSDPNHLQIGWLLVIAKNFAPLPTPTPPATPRPTSAPASPSGAGCHASGKTGSGVYKTIPGAGPEVALTFDMGGRMDPAVDIMNFLVANKVCATIFATGVMSQTAQGKQVLAIIKAHPELFEIANHTMYHCDLVRGGGGSPTTAPCAGSFDATRIGRELSEAEAILRAGTGQNPAPYWRPPYGSYNQAVLDAAAAAGYGATFMWDIDTIDWKPTSDGGPTAAQIAAKVVGNAVNGSNVLFHLGGYNTLDSLRLMVPALRDRGFTLTSLSDLLDGR